MLKEIWEIVKTFFIKLFQSRIFAVGVILFTLFGVLSVRLFNLQIINGENYNEEFIEKIERTVKTPGARGNIYDADGNLLAYNKLSYNVTIMDNGAYTNDYNARNIMLYKLATILEKHEVPVVSRFEVALDENGDYVYTTTSEAAKKRFLANMYGVTTDKLDQPDGKYPSDISAYDAVMKKVDDYAFNRIKDEETGAPIIPSDKTLLDMVKILYTMRQTAFQRYETTTIAQNINEECMAEILENQSELQGTAIEETYIRQYNNAKYFSHIIGYTGAVQDEKQLAELQKTNPNYEITDIVGATGIEKTMETALQGTKGEKHMYVDSYGQITKVISETEPKAGDDFYLTIQQNLQIGVYHLLEQQLASILANKIVNMPASEIPNAGESSNIVISVDDAYFQLINNNVLNTSHFTAEDAGQAEKQIAAAFESHKKNVLNELKAELLNEYAKPIEELSDEMVAYMVYIYDYLCKDNVGIVNVDKIDQQSESYIAWKNDTISLRNYLFSGISSGWIDTSRLKNKEISSKYEDATALYNQIIDFVMDEISEDHSFDKLIYKYMIIDRTGVSGRLLCMALYEQGILTWNQEKYDALNAGDENYAYSFLINCILNIQITPAQLALDPCMGSVVITDVNTGDIKALVTYPGYDNNKINDSEYFYKCLNDLSLPLINSATQTNKAPGSTFKPISAIAVLEEGKMGLEETVNCTGSYKEVDPPINCWIRQPGHGPLTVQQAIENSCNYCFAEFGHRLSMVEPEEGSETDELQYSTVEGVNKLYKYAAMFGLDRKSGIQIDEKEPHISEEDPERTAFGQATHSFNNVQLARYTTALANNGRLFNLTLLKSETDADGNEKQRFPAEQIGTIELKQSTWDIVHQGLRDVITTGAAKRVFNGYKTVEIAGKTGTAEEIKTRGNHGFFISYAPYNNPEIAVTTTIPFSYSSGNSATLARRVYDYYYGATDLPTIVSGTARGIEMVNIIDG
ncbi:MAG: penicillin-binding transpeptidase domain-containing protein [Eubacteriales bacterium]|nr:penicillin-binding transpeptidase domain-containing protein [Eubacteriales bacterium]